MTYTGKAAAEAPILLQEAIGRINDMLKGDDGQAWKEARKFVERATRQAAPEAPTKGTVGEFVSKVKPCCQDMTGLCAGSAATTASASDEAVTLANIGTNGPAPWSPAAPAPSQAAQAAHAGAVEAVHVFTCKDKGGEYELIGYSNGAGPKRGESIVVYRDVTKPDVLYHRSADDFKTRMQWLGARAAIATSNQKGPQA